MGAIELMMPLAEAIGTVLFMAIVFGILRLFVSKNYHNQRWH